MKLRGERVFFRGPARHDVGIVGSLCPYTLTVANMDIISKKVIDKQSGANMENFRLVYFDHQAPVSFNSHHANMRWGHTY